MEGRYLQIDFDQISVGSLLAPSAFSDFESHEVKAQFFDDLQAHLTKISRKRRDFIFCGNWAVAPKEDDLSNPEEQKNQSGFEPDEKQWMSQWSAIGYFDAFRQGNTDRDESSWWPSGEQGTGDAWRTDLQIASTALKHQVEYGVIYKKQQFSSHLAVIVDYDFELEPEPEF
jgi:exodeoxyribonuclease-3